MSDQGSAPTTTKSGKSIQGRINVTAGIGDELIHEGPVQSIGVPTPLVDGPEKVSGKALYTADFISNETLVGRIKRSPLAHAKILSIDTKRRRIELSIRRAAEFGG